MKHWRLNICAVFLLGFGLSGLQAQTMHVNEKYRTQTAYSLSSVRKMTFSNGTVTIQKNDNTTGIYTLSGLWNLNFTGLLTDNQAQPMLEANANLIVYPNPVINFLHIDLTGQVGDVTISILTLEGKVMQTQNTGGNSLFTMNLSNLSKGVYICRYSTQSEIRTVKIIKQ